MSSADSSPQNSLERLSTSEATELATGLAELVRSGLPLPEGLRALAEEWPTRKLGPVLRELAYKVEQGMSLDAAINLIGDRLPAYLRGLLAAGVRTGCLPEALEEFEDLERTQYELRRQVWLNLAYPTLLMILVSVLAILADLYITHQMAHIFKDFKTDLPLITVWVLKGAGPVSGILIFATALMLAIPLILGTWTISSWVSPVFYFLPFIGPPLKWSQMARFSRLMAMFLGQQVPLPECLRLTAKGVRDIYLARACRKAAAEVDQGRPLSESLAARPRFSSDLIPLVELGQRASNLGEAFQAAADMFEGRANTQGKNLEAFLLPATFFVIIFLCGVFVVALFMPLIALITRLTGGK
jgi:type II secretory pathway component PulF